MSLKFRKGLQVKYRRCTSLGFSVTVENIFRHRFTKDLQLKLLSRSTKLTQILINKLNQEFRKCNQPQIEPNQLEIVKDLESDEDITSFLKIFRRSVLEKNFASLKIEDLVNLSWKSKVKHVHEMIRVPLEIKVDEINNLQEISDKEKLHVALVCDKNSEYSSTRYEKVRMEDEKLYCFENDISEASNFGPFASFIDGERLKDVLNEFQYSSTSSYQGKL